MVNDLAIHYVGDSDARPVRRLSPINLPRRIWRSVTPYPSPAS